MLWSDFYIGNRKMDGSAVSPVDVGEGPKLSIIENSLSSVVLFTKSVQFAAII